MPIFYYKAKKGVDVTISGQVTAISLDDAIDRIGQLGLVPVSVEDQIVETSEVEKVPLRGVGAAQVNLFTRQLMNLIRAGVPILRALDIVAEQTTHTYLSRVIKKINALIRAGRSLSSSLEEFPSIFSPFYISLIKVGEESGRLKEVLVNIVEYQHKQKELNVKIKSALAYPLFMLVVGILSVIFILTAVMPRITSLFVEMKESLPWPTVVLLNISHVLTQQWYWLLLMVVVLGVGFYQLKNSSFGYQFFSRLKISLPLFGPLMLKNELAQFCRTAELLLKSGIPVLRTIQIATPLLENALLEEEFNRAHRQLLSGHTLGATLKQSEIIPSMVSDLISVGEESGSLTEVFSDIAQTFEEDSKETLKMMTTLLEPLMILVIGLVVGFIVFAMLLPVFQVDVLIK